MFIDCQLSWKAHSDYLCGKLATDIGMIVKARKLFDSETLTTLQLFIHIPIPALL